MKEFAKSDDDDDAAFLVVPDESSLPEYKYPAGESLTNAIANRYKRLPLDDAEDLAGGVAAWVGDGIEAGGEPAMIYHLDDGTTFIDKVPLDKAVGELYRTPRKNN